jgi:ketosteroid isomerase-like protein
VSESPIDRLLGAFDALDLDAALAPAAPDIRLLTADGRRAEGAAAVRELLADFFGQLRATTHTVTAEWHEGDAWIAEVEATYELKDRTRLAAMPRAFILLVGPAGWSDLRVYGAHEHPLGESRSRDQGMRIGGHWIPPL